MDNPFLYYQERGEEKRDADNPFLSFVEREKEKRDADKKKLVYTTITSTKTTIVATTILLNDACNGFKRGNFVCSPFSLETVLGMVAAGAQGETLKQLLGFLGHETIDQLLYESSSSKLFEQILSKPIPGLDISIANGVWLDKKLTGHVQSCYEEILRSVYKTKATFLDFLNKPEESARKINSWVNKKTKGLIPDIVDETGVRGVVVALANALYFKGLWSKPFSKYMTKKKNFHLINGETVSVSFMSSTEKFSFGSFEGVKILKIPYKSNNFYESRFSMYIFLPDKKDGLQDLLQLFHSDPALFYQRFDLKLWDFEELWIPKFKISYKFEAQEVMKQMGLTLPFKHTNMELTRILEPRVHGDMLYVSKILQKSFIEIDEKGTEAAACTFATGFMAFTCPAPPPQPPRPKFVADHPFMFMIREEESLAVMFIGVVLNPHA